MHYLDFEKPLYDLEAKIREIADLGSNGGINVGDEILRLQDKVYQFLSQTYATLSPWQKVQVARHPDRPHALDYIKGLVQEFTPLAGDRRFGDDHALIAGIGRFKQQPVCILGQEKGVTAEGRMRHNFGMPRPEGYRKAMRLMHLADRFSLPIISFVDTPGAYPGVDAEERGQAEAIASAIATCLDVDVPFVSVVIGEGGSGGAMAIATANHVMMLENAVYSVISPEGCSAILWRTKEQSQTAAEALKLTAEDLMRLHVVDSIVKEPLGGAHRGAEETIAATGEAVQTALQSLIEGDIPSFREHRRDKFLAMGKQFIA